MSIFMHLNETLDEVKGKPVWLNFDWWCNRSSRHPHVGKHHMLNCLCTLCIYLKFLGVCMGVTHWEMQARHGEFHHHLTWPTWAVRGTPTFSRLVFWVLILHSRLDSYSSTPKSLSILHHLDHFYSALLSECIVLNFTDWLTNYLMTDERASIVA